MAEDALQSQTCAEKLRALSEPLRLRIVDCLRGGQKNVSELATLLDVEIVTVSHHLGILHHAGLIARTKSGRFVYYRLEDDVLDPAADRSASDHLNLGCCRIELPPGSSVDTLVPGEALSGGGISGGGISSARISEAGISGDTVRTSETPGKE